MEVKEISKELGVSEDELVRKGVKAYLEMELRKVKAETYGVFSRYGVNSLTELDEKIRKGELSETETFEDFTKLDYLVSMREKIEKLHACGNTRSRFWLRLSVEGNLKVY